MKTFCASVLCVAMLFGGISAEGADKKKAKAISAYCHICEAASRISLQLVVMLAKHPYENALAGYAAKVADVNTDIFRRVRPPAGAEEVREHFGKAVAAFEKAVRLHRKAEYKASKEAAATCREEFWKAVAAVRKLRREGVIP